VSVAVFTSGTAGSPKAILHSFNTFYAGYSSSATARGLTSDDVLFSPHSLAHVVGQLTGNMIPLYLGSEALIVDTWDPGSIVDLLSEYQVTAVSGAPVFIEAIAAAAGGRNLRLPRLRAVITGATAVPASLVGTVRDYLDVTLQTAWGMTEVTGNTLTSATQDPPDWAARSIGRPTSALEVELRSDGDVSTSNPARMFVRGPSLCLATMPRDGGEVSILAEQDDGWYDTGDLAIPDGRGGFRLVGRAADRIGDVLMIPAADVEDALRQHPDIDDAALVGYGPGSELPCAVIVTKKPLTLEEIRGYLDGIGMTEWYQPQRLELVQHLPRNRTGKVDKRLLRERLQTPWIATIQPQVQTNGVGQQSGPGPGVALNKGVSKNTRLPSN
jgi:cyclohexanecarboxylate-CoA ligase